VREIISIRVAYAGAQEKKAVKQEGRKEEKSQEVYISRMCGATPSGRIPTKLGTYVRLTDVIKRAKFYRYNLRGFTGSAQFCSVLFCSVLVSQSVSQSVTLPSVISSVVVFYNSRGVRINE